MTVFAKVQKVSLMQTFWGYAVRGAGYWVKPRTQNRESRTRQRCDRKQTDYFLLKG
jgi:hypothetical protein